MRQRRSVAAWLLGAALGTLGSDPALSALEQGMVRLSALPEGAHVYVDGKRVHAEMEVLRLSPGWHEIQVEVLADERVMAARRWVEVQSKGLRTLTVTLRPVVAAGKTISPPGPPGPAGTPSPPSPPSKPVGPASDLESLKAPLDAALAHILTDLNRRMEALRRGFAPVFYYHDPESTAGVGPPGPRGPIGPTALPAPPDAARLLHDEAGRALLPLVRKHVGITDIEEELQALMSGPPLRLLPPEQRLRAWRISIRTPELWRRLDRERAQLLRPDAPPPRTPGPPGPAGPPFDEFGLGGTPPPIRLPDERVRQLLALFSEDQELQRSIEQLRRQLEDLALWRAEAERRIQKEER